MTTYAAARFLSRPARSAPRTAPSPDLSAVSLVLRFATVMSLLCAAAALPRSAWLTVSDVTVIGTRQLSAAGVLQRSGVRPGMLLVDVRPQAVAVRLRHPRIARVQVHASPRGQVQIHISERVPHAAVPYQEGFLILDHTGVVMERTAQPGRLPVVAVDGAAMPWVRMGDRVPAEGVLRALDVLQLLPAGELARGVGIRMDGSGHLHLATADGIRVLLGHPRGLVQRSATLPQVLAAVRRQRLVPASVDLRYAGTVIVRPVGQGGVRR